MKEETTEAGQISELKEELQKQREQIIKLSWRPNGMKIWERVTLIICAIHILLYWLAVTVVIFL